EVETGLADDETGLATAPGQASYYYARHSGAANELLRRRRRGGAALVVPGGISPSSGFAISADGRRLAYSTCRESMMLARLRPGAAPSELMPRRAWRDHFPVAVDTRHILFTSDRSGNNQVWLLDLGTSEARAVTGPNTTMAGVSPDHRRIV